MPTGKTISLNDSAKAVMPDGKIAGREEILSMLNLDPSTPPDAWLTILVSFTPNAAALRSQDAKALLQKGSIKQEMLSKSQLDAIGAIR